MISLSEVTIVSMSPCHHQEMTCEDLVTSEDRLYHAINSKA